MTGTAYKRSAELAGVVGPYDGLRPQRRGAHPGHAQARRRQRRRSAAVGAGRRATCRPLATKAWQQGLRDRRAATAGATRRPRVLAPTGTIGFMMDCDTTGIEPDLALVKFKKLVGGGSMQIVNQTVPRALRKLGYQEETGRGDRRVHRRARPRHRRAGPAPGALRGLRLRDGRAVDRADGPRADDGGGPAVPVRCDLQDRQPAGDGDRRGRSRTSTSQGWKLGLKALAIYRDNCKVGQPLSDAKAQEAPTSAVEAGGETVVEYRPIRKRLPKTPPVADHVVHRRRRRGLHDRRLLPGRRPRRGVPQARQAGLDPGRRDGRVLDRDLDRRCSTACRWRRYVVEVHQHALRPGRPDRRPGRPDGAVDHGLHLPAAGAGLPAVRRRGPSSASTPPTSGPGHSTPARTPRSSPTSWRTSSRPARSPRRSRTRRRP